MLNNDSFRFVKSLKVLRVVDILKYLKRVILTVAILKQSTFLFLAFMYHAMFLTKEV